MKAKLISLEIAQNRDLLFSLFLFHLKEEFLFAQRGPYAYKGPGGQSHPFTAHKLANTRALLHLRGRHNFPFLLFSLCPSIKYLNTQSCLRVLSSFYTVEVWISGFGKYIV